MPMTPPRAAAIARIVPGTDGSHDRRRLVIVPLQPRGGRERPRRFWREPGAQQGEPFSWRRTRDHAAAAHPTLRPDARAARGLNHGRWFAPPTRRPIR